MTSYILLLLIYLDVPKNSLTIFGRFLNKYANNLTRIIPYIHQIGELLERESLLTDELERKYLQEKIKTLSVALDDLLKTTTPIVPLLKGLETGNAPGQGKIKEVQPERNNNERPRNPMQDIFSQLTQPENMSNMMGMVEQMMNPRGQQGGTGPSTGTGTGQGTQPGTQGRQPGAGGMPGGLGGLMSSMMGNMMSNPGLSSMMSNMMGGINRNNSNLSNNLSRTVSNASVDTNVPNLNMHRTMSNGGLIDLNNYNLSNIITLLNIYIFLYSKYK